MFWRRLRSILFPYTTLFRSCAVQPSRTASAAATASACARHCAASARGRWGCRGGSACFPPPQPARSEEHTSELQSHVNIVCRLMLETKNGVVYPLTYPLNEV